MNKQQLNGVWIPDIMKEVLGEEATDIILSNPDEFKKWLKRGIWNCKRLNELSNCKTYEYLSRKQGECK